MTDFTAFPIANVTIPSLPDLGGVTDASMLVGERAGTGRFAATGLRDYVMTTVGAGYLPLAGGTLTGDLAVPDLLFFTSSGMSFSTSADYSVWTLDSSNADLIYTRASGLLRYRRSDGAELWSVNGAGDCSVARSLVVAGAASIGATGIIYTGVPSNSHLHAFGWTTTHVAAFVDGVDEGQLAWTSDVTALEARIDQLQARIAELERDRAELQETLNGRVAALEARMGTGTTD